MKLHAAFPSTPNKLCVRNTSCFCQNCFRIRVNEANIVPNINDHVEALYDRKVYIGMAPDSNAKIPFYEHAGTLSIGSSFCEPKKMDKIWVDLVNILCVVTVPTETRRGKKFEKFVIQNGMEKFSVWKNKN